MKAELVNLSDAVAVFGNDAQKKETLAALGAFFANPEDKDAEATLVKNKTALRDLQEFREIAEATLKNFKAQLEFAAATVPALLTEFKWSKPRKSTACVNMEEFFKLATELYGVAPECFAAKMKGLTSKDAAELIGVSEQVLLEAHGDIFETKEAKPSLSRAY